MREFLGVRFFLGNNNSFRAEIFINMFFINFFSIGGRLSWR